MRIIGITGTFGAGKGTIVNYLTERYGYEHYSVRAYIVEEIKRRNLEENRDTMRTVGNDMRKDDGAFILKALKKRAEDAGHTKVIIESIRTVDEVKGLHAMGGILFAVDADQQLRYERAAGRRSSTDEVSFDVFVQQEALESVSANPTQQNLRECHKLADFRFANDGTTEDLYARVDSAMDELAE